MLDHDKDLAWRMTAVQQQQQQQQLRLTSRLTRLYIFLWLSECRRPRRRIRGGGKVLETLTYKKSSTNALAKQ